MVVVTHQAKKIWTYDHTTVQLSVQSATFNMRGQLYCRHANTMALSSSPVVSALGSESDNLTCGKKKMRALLLGLAKSMFLSYTLLTHSLPLVTKKEFLLTVSIQYQADI